MIGWSNKAKCCTTCAQPSKVMYKYGEDDVCYKCAKQHLYWNFYQEERMTPDDIYSLGYEDGKAGKAMAATYQTDENYIMGYEDGKGDSKIEKPVSGDYSTFNDPPDGFEYAGMKEVPGAYEYYLSKGGSPTYLTRERRNGQTRHILRCSTCGKTEAFHWSGGNSGLGEGCTCHPEVKGRS